MSFQVVFRTDASLEIGAGHVARCLSLANSFERLGWSCLFLCRARPGSLGEHIQANGHQVEWLPAAPPAIQPPEGTRTEYSSWLGGEWRTDALQTTEMIAGMHPRLLVVDHYAIDAKWESIIRLRGAPLLVVDDLADRPHDCDFLLDQNLGRRESEYASLLPSESVRMLGPEFALLRPQFAEFRAESISRRKFPRLDKLIVSLGGVDYNNVTGRVLDALRDTGVSRKCAISVVMGEQSRWIADIQGKAARWNGEIEVLAGVRDMARLMTDCDLAIGAGGSTSWERCALGLPSIVIPIAPNQEGIASALENAGAAVKIPLSALESALSETIERLCRSPGILANMGHASAEITDGQGTSRVVSILMKRIAS